MPRVRVPEAASGLARVAAGSMVRRGAGSGRAVATVAASGFRGGGGGGGGPGSGGGGRRGHRGHGQGPAERPELLLPFASRAAPHNWRREGGRPRGRDRAREEGAAAGGGGAWGRGRKLLEQQPRATSITFNFKSERRELEKYRRRDLAEAREGRLEGSRVAAEHLWTRRKERPGEREPGAGSRGGTAGAVGPLRRAALSGRGGRAPAASVEVEGPAAARPPAPRPPPPPRGRLRAGRVSAARGRARSASSGAERPGSLAPRLPEPARKPAARRLAPRPPGPIAGGFQATDRFPRLLEPPLVSLLSFLSFQ